MLLIRKLSLIKRSLHHFLQKLVRGFSDDETWSLDYSLAKLILPRLVRFKKLNIGYPHGLSEHEWNAKLDGMIVAFEFLGSEERWDCYEQKKWDEVQESLNEFAKYYLNLWW